VADNTFDFQKKGRAYGRIAFAYQEMGELNKAAEYFEKSLLENADRRIKDALKVVQDMIKKQETDKYINPELAEEANNKANELYKAGKYPEALLQYNESIKRNPKNPKYYSNRAAVYIKLMEFGHACSDCEKALELDPKFLRAVQRKATCQTMMKQYHKAIDTYEKGMKDFPNDKELKEGYYKVMNLINASGTAEDEEARVKGAYSDPEIQKIVMDPRIQQLFKDLKDNPKVAQDAIMKDEFIGSAFKKLVAAGIIKTK
jgi:stress-induced-phosphoprotein 1